MFPGWRGELSCGVRGDARAKLGGVDRDDPGEVIDVVEFEVLMHAEPFAEWSGEHAAASGGPDDRELFEGEADRARRHPFAQHDVDPEIFHDGIDELLDGARQAMDLVNEEDRALGRVGEEGHDVHFLVERRAACDVELDAQLIVEDGGERRLAQAGRAVEEDMGKRLRLASLRPPG